MTQSIVRDKYSRLLLLSCMMHYGYIIAIRLLIMLVFVSRYFHRKLPSDHAGNVSFRQEAAVTAIWINSRASV